MIIPYPVDEKYILKLEEKLGLIFLKTFKKKMMIENGWEIIVENDVWMLFPLEKQARFEEIFSNLPSQE